MKKTLLLIIFTIFCLASIFATDEISLTSEQEREYVSKALSVVPRMETTYSTLGGVYFSFYDSITLSTTLGKGTESLKWDAYLGPQRISMGDFFDLTGQVELKNEYIEMQKRISKRHKAGWIWTAVGSTSLAAGITMVLVIDDGAITKAEEALLTIGATLSFASSVPLTLGLINLFYDEEMDVSADFALSLANIYNKELAAKISVSY